MGAYYKYFAYGLSQDEDYVAWVEPYEFASGIGQLSLIRFFLFMHTIEICY